LDFGAFVDLGGVEGLIPVREISWERIDNPASVLKSGDGVTVKVMRIDRENGKISLSRRECVARVFKKSAEEVAAEETAAEVSAWMKEAEKKNANVGSIAGAFDKLGL
jgi:small subunit ribosomal protein S1